MEENEIQLPAANELERTDVLSLLEECKEKVAEYALQYHANAELNERMCNGDQFIEIDEGFEVGPMEWGSDVPKISRNLLRNLRLTWSSRILEDRPFVQFFPGEAGADQLKVQVAEKVMEYLKQQNDFDDLCFRAAELVQPHSCVGFKVYWDPLKGPRDEQGRTQGDVRWDLVSIFDYGTDGAEDIEDSKWVYFARFIDKWDAMGLLEASGKPIDEMDETEYTDTWGTKKKGVRLYELWWRPDDYRYPNGLYAVILGDQVIEARDFPYAHGELPLAVWKCGARRGSPYGSSHVDDAVPIQRLINECVAALAKQARLISSIKLLAPQDVITKWAHGHQQIPVAGKDMMESTKYLEPPDRVAVLTSTLEDAIESIFAVFGLNELLTGSENLKSGTAAKSIAYINKLDSMKMAGAARNLAKAILRIVRQSLKLVQQYVVAERLMPIAGTQNQLPVDLFIGADIAGVDVVVQPGSAIESMRASVADQANQQMQQTGPNPQLMSQAQTGLKDTAFTNSQRELVFAQIQQAVMGQQVIMDPNIDAGIAVDVIVSLMPEVPPDRRQGLVQLLYEYQQSQANQQVKQQQEQNAVETMGQVKT